MPDDEPRSANDGDVPPAETRKTAKTRRLADFGTLDADLSRLPDEQALSDPHGGIPLSPTSTFSTIDPGFLGGPMEASPGPKAESRPASDPGTVEANVFDLVGGDETEAADEPPPPPPARPGPAERAEKPKAAEPRPEPRVDEVWSRGKEWAPTLLGLAAVAAVTLLLVFFSASAENFTLAFTFLLCGGIAFVLLSYPILITLERPVRMTPEQAVRDFYGALSHQWPHFRRMWLLLSTHGRTSTQFGSYEGFVACWKRWLGALRGPDDGKSTPFHFEIVNVKAEKSAGQTAVKVEYKVRIFLRGRRNGEPLATYSVRQWTVRGPDGMWYLDDGVPPDSRDQRAPDRQRVTI